MRQVRALTLAARLARRPRRDQRYGHEPGLHSRARPASFRPVRKLYLLLGTLLAAHLALLFLRPRGSAAAEAESAVTVGVVFDVGGRGDKSFNDGAYIGAERAIDSLGVRVRFVEPGEGSDREAGLRLLAAEDVDLVAGIGFIFSDDLTELATEYPKVHFAGVDYALKTDDAGRVVPPPANLAALKFREEEGSFLVGALAALAGGSKKVGFVGGMDMPLIHKFEAGYRAGVRYVCPDCTVIAQYAGVTPEAFRNPGRGKELALSQYQQGVNVIFHASGSTGLGVFEAARAMGKGHYGIGVDADQYDEAPGFVLTSMVKGVDNVIFDTVKRVKAGTFRGGVYSYGLKEGGLGYVYDARNRALIPDSVHARVERLKQDIIAGQIKVPVER
jgi:basic membrane protein A and related proteins